MFQGFYGYQKGNVETCYTVEYIDNEKDWKRFLNAQKMNATEDPWEAYQTKEFDNISEAVQFWIIKYMMESTYDIKLTETVVLDGEIILEQYIEPSGTMSYYLKMIINSNMQKENERLSSASEALSKELAFYQEFLKEYHAEETFKEWRKER